MAAQPLNDPAEIPPELDRWNWGAFFFNWIWGIGNSVFVALLALVPGIGLIVMIVLGVKGSRWAWRNRAWRDAEHFRRVQRKWAIAGFIVWVLVLGAAVVAALSVPLLLKNSEAYRLTMQAVSSDAHVAETLGPNVRQSGYLVSGSIHLDALAGGNAVLSFSVKGDKGSGTVISRGVRRGGVWEMRLIVVQVDGTKETIVLVNKDNVPIPRGGAMSI